MVKGNVLPYRVQIWVVDATDHGRELVELSVSSSASTYSGNCGEAVAVGLLRATQAQLESLDTSTLLQRLMAACVPLRAANPPCDSSLTSSAVDSVLAILQCAVRSEVRPETEKKEKLRERFSENLVH
jgi:hypothetical protein